MLASKPNTIANLRIGLLALQTERKQVNSAVLLQTVKLDGWSNLEELLPYSSCPLLVCHAAFTDRIMEPFQLSHLSLQNTEFRVFPPRATKLQSFASLRSLHLRGCYAVDLLEDIDAFVLELAQLRLLVELDVVGSISPAVPNPVEVARSLCVSCCVWVYGFMSLWRRRSSCICWMCA
jgi:hypothetical protein